MFRWKMPFIIFSISIFALILLSSGALIVPTHTQALYWTPLPPYNVLWPLWSPALSPTDPITGLPTPLISSLTSSTILPVQPGLAWDPCQPGVEAFPWLLYNTPAALGGGLVYYDVYYGINPWPPSYMLDPLTGAPAPITLPATWTLLGPPSLSHFDWFVPLANALFSLQFGVPISNLLTSANIWGFPPLSTLPSPII